MEQKVGQLERANAGADTHAQELTRQQHTLRGEKEDLLEAMERQRLQLSEARASAVVSYLAAQGIAPDHLTATGYGETQPIASNNTRAGRAQNRRITFTVSAR